MAVIKSKEVHMSEHFTYDEPVHSHHLDLAKQKLNTKERSLYFLTIVMSLLILLVSHLIIKQSVPSLPQDQANLVQARIEKIVNTEQSESGLAGEKPNLKVNFTATLLTGERQGERIVGYQSIDFSNPSDSLTQVKSGDRVLLFSPKQSDNPASANKLSPFVFVEYDRHTKLIWLFAVFAIALLAFGHLKGLNTLLSLVLTVLMIFLVFIPSILAAYNVYLMTLLTCLYGTLISFLLVIGYNAKAYAATIGCLAGVSLSGLLAIICNYWLKISGLTGDEAITLANLPLPNKINLPALIFAMVLIGALGAVMDVAMDISSALAQVKLQAPNLKRHEIFKIGLDIGRDLISTLSNTLIMAYIGTSLLTVLVLSGTGMSWNFFINRESFAVDILNAIIGTLAILFTIPLTAFVCAWLYNSPKAKLK